MNEQNIKIWDDIYPCEFFEEDILNNRLYILIDNDDIVSAFALTKNNAGEATVEWTNNSDKIYYLDRLGVNKKYKKWNRQLYG